MNNQMRFIFFAVMFFFTSCSVSKQVNIPVSEIYNNWKVVEIGGNAVHQSDVWLNLSDKMNANIYTGCDSLKFTPRYASGNFIQIQLVTNTTNNCSTGTVENQIIQLLPQSYQYEIIDNYLVLKNKNNNTLIKAAMFDTKLMKKWMVKKMGNLSFQQLLDAGAYMDFSNPGHISAFMGCNGLGMSYSLNGRTIKLSQSLGTLMYCEGKMDVEKEFTSLINQVTAYKIQGHFLSLLNKKGKELIQLVAEDWD